MYQNNIFQIPVYDVDKIQKDYIDKIFQGIIGLKALILDQETKGLLSLIYSHSSLLKQDIFLLERIDLPTKGEMLHLKAIYLIRPTQTNYQVLMKELLNPRFIEYYIYFTNAIDIQLLKQLAEIDREDLIQTVQEIQMDYYVISKDLVTLNQTHLLNLYKKQNNWNQQDKFQFQRILEGIYSVLTSKKRIPIIKYLSNSLLDKQIAEQLAIMLLQEAQQNPTAFDYSQKCLLIITDRREDPITPILYPWTYQAMIHEYAGIVNNKVDLNQLLKALNEEEQIELTEEQSRKIFILSPESDEFYKENMYNNFGELANNLKNFIETTANQSKQETNITTIDDMKKILDKIPDIKQQQTNLSKHVNISAEISKQIEQRQILAISELEQDIVCKDEQKKQTQETLKILGDPQIKNYEKLKLFLIYQLKYENSSLIPQLREQIERNNSINTDFLDLPTKLIAYAGKQVRKGDLFQDKDIIQKLQKKYNQIMKGIPNIYTQHQPQLAQTIKLALENKLRDSIYTTLLSDKIPFQGMPNEVIILQVGGTTYEEAKVVNLYNQKGEQKVLLVGTYIHNSRTFLEEIQEIKGNIQN